MIVIHFNNRHGEIVVTTGFQCFVKGHFHMWPGGTTDPQSPQRAVLTVSNKPGSPWKLSTLPI